MALNEDSLRAPGHDSDRVRVAMTAWRRRSRVIRVFRRVLPVSIAAVAVLVLGWAGLKSLLSRLPDLAGRGATIRMTNPRFFGQDEQGRSFVMGALEAVRTGGEDGEVRLTKPLLSLTTGPDRTLVIAAGRGRYDPTSRQARMEAGVRLADSGSGYSLETAEAVVDTRTSQVSGNTSVVGRGPLGEIRAANYALDEKGERMRFGGGVRTHIIQRRHSAAPAGRPRR